MGHLAILLLRSAWFPCPASARPQLRLRMNEQSIHKERRSRSFWSHWETPVRCPVAHDGTVSPTETLLPTWPSVLPRGILVTLKKKEGLHFRWEMTVFIIWRGKSYFYSNSLCKYEILNFLWLRSVLHFMALTLDFLFTLPVAKNKNWATSLKLLLKHNNWMAYSFGIPFACLHA